MTAKTPKPPPATSRYEQTTEKISISIRFPTQLASWLRKKAADEGVSFNEFVVSRLDDLRTWFWASPPVAEALEADREAFADTPSAYILRLFQYRYDEIGRDPHKFGKPPASPLAKK
jgi:hypothetical protein